MWKAEFLLAQIKYSGLTEDSLVHIRMKKSFSDIRHQYFLLFKRSLDENSRPLVRDDEQATYDMNNPNFTDFEKFLSQKQPLIYEGITKGIQSNEYYMISGKGVEVKYLLHKQTFDKMFEFTIHEEKEEKKTKTDEDRANAKLKSLKYEIKKIQKKLKSDKTNDEEKKRLRQALKEAKKKKDDLENEIGMKI